MQLFSSMFSSAGTSILVVLLSAMVMLGDVLVRADLTYYLYLEDAPPGPTTTKSNNAGAEHETNTNNILVVESLGSLPFHQSHSTTDGETCPQIVAPHGGINTQFLCTGSHPQSQTTEQKKKNHGMAFFPIRAVTTTSHNRHDDTNTTNTNRLPFKFTKFETSSGTASGVLVWRNVLAISTSTIENDDNSYISGHGNIDLAGTSFGKDQSKQQYNSAWFQQTSSAINHLYEEGEVLREWTLLSSAIEGTPVPDGTIRLIKGRPPLPLPTPNPPVAEHDDGINTMMSTPPNTIAVDASTKDSKDEVVLVVGTESVSTKNAEEAEEDSSITGTICADRNNEYFGRFCSLLMQVGWDATLAQCQPQATQYTLMVPTNAAFHASFNRTDPAVTQPQSTSGHDLSKLLENHIMAGTVLLPTEMRCNMINFMENGQQTTLGCNDDENNKIVTTITGEGDHEGQHPPPQIIPFHKLACNGILHMLDRVILPSDNPDEEDEEHHHHHSTTVIAVTTARPEEQNSSREDPARRPSPVSSLKEPISLSTTTSTSSTSEELDRTTFVKGHLNLAGTDYYNNAAGTAKDGDDDTKAVVVGRTGLDVPPRRPVVVPHEGFFIDDDDDDDDDEMTTTDNTIVVPPAAAANTTADPATHTLDTNNHPGSTAVPDPHRRQQLLRHRVRE